MAIALNISQAKFVNAYKLKKRLFLITKRYNALNCYVSSNLSQLPLIKILRIL